MFGRWQKLRGSQRNSAQGSIQQAFQRQSLHHHAKTAQGLQWHRLVSKLARAAEWEPLHISWGGCSLSFIPPEQATWRDRGRERRQWGRCQRDSTQISLGKMLSLSHMASQDRMNGEGVHIASWHLRSMRPPCADILLRGMKCSQSISCWIPLVLKSCTTWQYFFYILAYILMAFVTVLVHSLVILPSVSFVLNTSLSMIRKSQNDSEISSYTWLYVCRMSGSCFRRILYERAEWVISVWLFGGEET